MDLSPLFTEKPELGKIFTLNGDMTIDEYITLVAAQVKKANFSYFSPRFVSFAQTYSTVISPILGTDVAERSLETLARNRLVSTADHHGIIAHPFFLSTTYARSISAQKTGQQAVITFSCAGVSLSNSSLPRGLGYHTNEGVLKKLYFHSLAFSQMPVYSAPQIDQQTIQSALDHVESNSLIKNFLQSLKEDKHFFNLPDYDAQCTYVSHTLWKKVPGFENIDLIYLSEERLTTALLLDHHLGQGAVIDHLLTDEKVLALFEKYFDGITGAFDTKTVSGTFLFWAFVDGHRVPLKRVGNTLQSPSGTSSLTLDADSIKQALLQKKIYPSMALCFITLSFYYGFVCGGGFSQVSYLKKLKDAWMKLLLEVGNIEEAQAVSMIDPSVFLGEVVALTDEHGEPLYSLDLLGTLSEATQINYQKTTMRGGFLRMTELFESTLRSVFD